jgi:hypothetical protein
MDRAREEKSAKAVKSQLSLPKTSKTKQGHEGDPVFYNNVVHS